jgi:SAM-dependent methyltransferase
MAVADEGSIPARVPHPAQDVPLRPRRPEDFDGRYASTPAWDIDRPQPALAAVATSGEVRGRVLDAGCGTGEHALMAARLGLVVVGVDTARAAIERAELKAAERGCTARFVIGDALDLAFLGQLGPFDTVLDSGLFHIFEDGDRRRYVDNLAVVMPPGGRYFMLCFSRLVPGDWGPRRVSEEEIRDSFRDGWRVDAVEATRMVLTTHPDGVCAWMASITRN